MSGIAGIVNLDGAPVDRAVVERIEEQPVVEEPEPSAGWGLLADLLWLAVLGAAIWAIVAFSWG